MTKFPGPISFDWDESNIEKNWKKHKVHYREAEEVFSNRQLKLFEDIKHSQKENRLIALGSTNQNRLLYIIFTMRNQKIRIISARDQSKKERRLYEKIKGNSEV